MYIRTLSCFTKEISQKVDLTLVLVIATKLSLMESYLNLNSVVQTAR